MVAWLNNISVGRKLTMIVAAMCVPLFLMAGLFVNAQMSSVRFAQKEQQGLAHARPLWTTLTQIHAQDVSQPARLPQVLPSYPPSEEYAKVFDAAQKKIARLDRNDGASVDETAQAVALVMTRVADDSGLTLDPDVDTFYLQNALMSQMPEIINLNNTLMFELDRGTDSLDSNRQAVAFAVAGAKLDQAYQALEFDLNSAVAGTRAQLLEARIGAPREVLKKAVSDFEQARTAIEQRLSAAQPVTSDEKAAFESAHVGLEAAVEQLWQVQANELDRLLAARIASALTTLTEMLSAAVLISLGSIALSWLIARTMSGQLLAMSKVMSRLANEDMSVEIPSAGQKDEVGVMANAILTFREICAERKRAQAVRQAERTAQLAKLERERRLVTEFKERMVQTCRQLAGSSGELADAAQNLAATAEETTRQSRAVTGAAENTSQNVQTVAAASEEMTAAIQEITSQIRSTTNVSRTAAETAMRTQDDIRGLAAAAQGIGDVVKLINDIASQTNLLALNATIESARAGDAGKGFAVVAAEVKALAQQTGRATEDITRRIQEIQDASRNSVHAMDDIASQVDAVRNMSGTVAAAAEQQGAAMQEIASNTAMAATSTIEVSENISGVERAAQMTGAASAQMLALSQHLNEQAEQLQEEFTVFVRSLEAA